MTKEQKIYVFALLLNATADYSKVIEEDLVDYFDLEISTKYRARFSASRNEARKMEKNMKNEKAAFKKNVKQMVKHLDSFATHFDGGDDATFDRIIDMVHEQIEKGL